MTIAATKACSATRSVIQSALSSDGHSLASFEAMSLGFGNRKIGTLAVRQTISHTADHRDADRERREDGHRSFRLDQRPHFLSRLREDD